MPCPIFWRQATCSPCYSSALLRGGLSQAPGMRARAGTEELPGRREKHHPWEPGLVSQQLQRTGARRKHKAARRWPCPNGTARLTGAPGQTRPVRHFSRGQGRTCRRRGEDAGHAGALRGKAIRRLQSAVRPRVNSFRARETAQRAQSAFKLQQNAPGRQLDRMAVLRTA